MDADVASESAEPEFADVVDVATLQSMMDDFYALTRIPMAVIDLRGEVVVGAGWQEVCTKFHRANPETCAYCVESDTALTTDIPAGTSRLYKCKNGMWDAAMPVVVGQAHIANVFTGQFFFDDESIDMDFFRQQAHRYGFDERDYLAAVSGVPRLSRATVDVGLNFLTKLSIMISQLGLSNIQRARTEVELQTALERKTQLSAQLATERGILQQIMNNTGTHLAYLDSDFNFVAVNSAYVRASGCAEAELIGRSHFELFPDDDNEAIFTRARDTGVAVQYVAKPFEYADQPWRGVTYWDWCLTPVKDLSGAVQGLVFSLVDVTQAERARSFSDALNTLNDVIHASLDFDAAVSEIVEHLASAIGCEAAAVLLESPDHRMYVVDAFGLPNELKSSVLDQEQTRSLVDRLTQAQSIILTDPSSPELTRGLAAALGVQSIMVFPLTSAGTIQGALCFCYRSGPGAFDAGQVDFACKVAASLSLSLENARLYQAEHRIAETLQETLVVLPSHVPGIAFSRAYESATSEAGRVGGDFVDVFEVHDHVVGIALGDVSGKGIDAAVTTSLIRTTLRVHAVDGLSPVKVATKTNEVMRRFTETHSFVTLWFGLLNTETGHLRYISAGHPPALVVSRDGDVRRLEGLDPILGAFDEVTYFECHSVLAQGDRLVLYSDGVTEARSPQGDFLNEEGLIEVVRRRSAQNTSALSQAIMDDVRDYSEGMLRDDAAILSVETVG